MTTVPNPDAGDLQPDLDSRNTAGPMLSASDFPTAPTPPTKPGIGTPWLGMPADPYSPKGGSDPDFPHLFHLQNADGNFFDGGSLQGANAENWPILVEQKGAVYLVRLAPGGVREPHWHPSAWEVNYVIAGTVRWSFVGPNSTQDVFEGGAGDLIFAPQGHFHYFENASDTDDLLVLIVFNADATEPKDDIGLAQAISSVPAPALGAIFGVDPSVFENLPTVQHRVTIVKRGDLASGS